MTARAPEVIEMRPGAPARILHCRKVSSKIAAMISLLNCISAQCHFLAKTTHGVVHCCFLWPLLVRKWLRKSLLLFRLHFLLHQNWRQTRGKERGSGQIGFSLRSPKGMFLMTQGKLAVALELFI